MKINSKILVLCFICIVIGVIGSMGIITVKRYYPEIKKLKQIRDHLQLIKNRTQALGDESYVPNERKTNKDAVERTYISSRWSMKGHDPQHTGYSPYIGPQTDNLKWTFRTKSIVESSPAIGPDGTIYVGSYDNNLYAINPNGALKWAFPTRSVIRSSPAVDQDGTIYVGSHDRCLYAINPDGSLKWIYTIDGIVTSPPSIGPDGTIYFVNRNIFALNPDGTLKWKYRVGRHETSTSPTIGLDGTIYIGSGSPVFYAFTPNGRVKWRFRTDSNIRANASVGADGSIYVGTKGGILYALTEDGKLKWKFPTGSQIRSSTAIGPDGTIYLGSWDVYLYAINPDGTLKWAYKTGAPIEASPAIGADGTIYVGSTDGNFHAIDQGGKLKWRSWIGLFQGSPAIGSDGTLYVGSMHHKLFAFGTPMPKIELSTNQKNYLRGQIIKLHIQYDNLAKKDAEIKLWMELPSGNYLSLAKPLSHNSLSPYIAYEFKETDELGIYRLGARVIDSVSGLLYAQDFVEVVLQDKR